jgi:beta-galactosidase
MNDCLKLLSIKQKLARTLKWLTPSSVDNQVDVSSRKYGTSQLRAQADLQTAQRKGIRTGVMADLHFMTNWQHYWLAARESLKKDRFFP